MNIRELTGNVTSKNNYLQAVASQILKASSATRNELVNAVSAGTVQIS